MEGTFLKKRRDRGVRRLMILEVSQKQAYIFASHRLRENAARSEDIRYVTESRFFQTAAGPLYREEDLVYAGAATRCCNLTAGRGRTPLPGR